MTQQVESSIATPGRRVLRSVYANRRRLATGAAMLIASVIGYYAVAGDNGLTVYKQKRREDQQLALQIEHLKRENARLQAHVERLRNDPAAIEHEAREKLHYTRPGEVIYTLSDEPDPSHPAPATPARPHGQSSAQGQSGSKE